MEITTPAQAKNGTKMYRAGNGKLIGSYASGAIRYVHKYKCGDRTIASPNWSHYTKSGTDTAPMMRKGKIARFTEEERAEIIARYLAKNAA